MGDVCTVYIYSPTLKKFTPVEFGLSKEDALLATSKLLLAGSRAAYTCDANAPMTDSDMAGINQEIQKAGGLATGGSYNLFGAITDNLGIIIGVALILIIIFTRRDA